MKGIRFKLSALWACLGVLATMTGANSRAHAAMWFNPWDPLPPPPVPGCVPDGGIDDTLYITDCCSGTAVPGSTVCTNPADYGTTWLSCTQTCSGGGTGNTPGNPGGSTGCIANGGIDDTLYVTDCCSGVAVPGSTVCSTPGDYGTTWLSCTQTCAGPAASNSCPIFSCASPPTGCMYSVPYGTDINGCPTDCGTLIDSSTGAPCGSPPNPPPPVTPPPTTPVPPAVPLPPVCLTEAGEIHYEVRWNDGVPGSEGLYPTIEGDIPFRPESIYKAKYPWE